MGRAASGAGLSFLLLVAVGCGGPPDTPFVDLGPDEGRPDMGEDAGPSDECNVAGSPVVSFVGTLAGPADTIHDEVFTATCRTADGTASVDPSTLSLVVNNAAGDRVLDPALAMGAVEGDWDGEINVPLLSAGAYTVRCYVEDEDGECGAAIATFGVDDGPSVLLTSPALDSAFSGTMTVAFTIMPQPVFPDDAGAEVSDITLTVADAVIPSSAITNMGDGRYQAVINFTDTSLYPVPLGGTYFIEIEASNQRGKVTSVTRTFIVDAMGPVITFLQPTVAQLVGGAFDVRVRIVDPLGVADEPTLTVGGEVLTLVPIPSVPNEYFRSVEATGFGDTVRELTLTVIARDRALNTRVQSQSVKLDSRAPLVSLAPGNVRYTRTGYTNCSAPMNPVGTDAAQDREVLGTAAEFRVRAEDQANIAFGDTGTAQFLAGVASNGVAVYILDDTTVPLLVDTDGDDVCDSINPDIDPEQGATTNLAVVLNFVGVNPYGAPTNANPLVSSIPWPADPDVTADPPAPECMQGSPPYTNPTTPICGTTDLTWVMSSVYGPNTQTIFAKPPVTPQACTGDSWDFQSNIAEGWACVVARATDTVGNVGLSPAIRTCFVSSAGSVACGSVPVGSLMPNDSSVPSCTDGCTMPQDLTSETGFNLIQLR